MTKKKIGRPKKPTTEKKINTSIRLKPETKKKLVNDFGSVTSAVNTLIKRHYGIRQE